MPIARSYALAVYVAAVALLALAVAPASAQSGQQLYTQWCQGCHGNPMNNKDNVLGGKDWNIIKLAMDTKPTMTAELRPAYNAGLITDETFQTIATYLQTFGGGVVAALQMPSAINFGTLNVGVASSVTSRNISTTASSNAAVQISSVTSTNPLEFVVVSNSCNGAFVFPGSPCSVGVQFTPAAAGARSGKITVTSNGTGSPQTFDVSGTGQSGTPPPPPTGNLTVPSSLAFGSQAVGVQSASQAINVTNGSAATVTVSNVQTSSATEFPIVSNNCGSVGAGGGCTIQVAFKPSIAGSRVGTITITSNGSGSPQQVTLTGTGASAPPPPPSANKVPAVEYYNASLGHYFTTAYPAEIQVLDSGQVGGWVRTGQFFYAYDATTAGTNPVCRFYLPPAYGNSHFYSAIPTECNAVLVQQPAFILESSTAFHIASPNPTTGECPAGTLPVYRLWNQKADTNHRFTTSLAVRDQMVAAGFVAEGYGIGYTMCAPP